MYPNANEDQQQLYQEDYSNLENGQEMLQSEPLTSLPFDDTESTGLSLRSKLEGNEQNCDGSITLDEALAYIDANLEAEEKARNEQQTDNFENFNPSRKRSWDAANTDQQATIGENNFGNEPDRFRICHEEQDGSFYMHEFRGDEALRSLFWQIDKKGDKTVNDLREEAMHGKRRKTSHALATSSNKRSYASRKDYRIAEHDGVLELWLGESAYAAAFIEQPRPKATLNVLVFLAFWKGIQRQEAMEGVMEARLTMKELYENVWSFSPFYKEFHQKVEPKSFRRAVSKSGYFKSENEESPRSRTTGNRWYIKDMQCYEKLEQEAIQAFFDAENEMLRSALLSDEQQNAFSSFFAKALTEFYKRPELW